MERVPVEEKMALIFSATCRFLPTPETTTIPPSDTVSRMSLTAETKDAPSESRVFSRPSISTAKTCFARAIISLSVMIYFVVDCSSVTQIVPTMSSAEHPRERSFIAFARPWRFGPIASASPRRCAIL